VAILRLELAKLRGFVNPADVFLSIHKQDPNSFWLDRSTHPDEPVSIIGSAGSILKLGEDPLEEIANYLAKLKKSIASFPEQEIPFSFRPGLVGYVGYEMLSGARDSQPHEPVAELMVIDRAMVFDHRDRHMYFIGLFETEAEFQNWHRAALLRLTLVGGELASYTQLTKEPKIISSKLRHSPEKYLELISKCKEHIASGDVYQLCLTNQILIEHDADPLKAFLTLREQNPAPYGSYLRIGQREIVSSSPEQFLKVTTEGKISSKPIKGTRPRSKVPVEDELLAKELRENQKEQAENLMIVDLMRNDLGKVCEPGSVVVDKLFDIESYATVHQLVSTVTGTLRPEYNAVSALASCFPAGSMTGAPKLKAIEILEKLEAGPRGVYSGAIGYLGFDGSADLGMTIRTLVFEGKFATVGVGGGITVDSIPNQELEETMLKAEALLRTLGQTTWNR
jgi:para-aminobenzoate synthetase component I